MKSPKIGATAEMQFVVEQKHSIDFFDDRMPAVLSTPWLVWFLEHTARQAILPALEPGESTVGTNIEIEHLAATPLGKTVRCVARIVHADNLRISFHVEARDEQELIARGFHRLQVIQVERFAARVRNKMK